MNREKELIRNTAIVAIGKICTKIWIFVLLPFYTAMLSTEEYGTVELINTYVSLLLPVVAFQISDALFRFTIDARKEPEKLKRIVSTIILFCMFQSVMFGIVFGIGQSFLDIPYKIFLYLNVLANIFSGAFLQLCRGMGDNTGYAVGSFFIAGSAVVLNIALVLIYNWGAKGLLIATFISHMVGIAYIVWKEKVFKLLRLKYFDAMLLKDMLSYSLPLIPNYLCWWILGASDKTVVSYFLGVAENGILSVSQKFSTAYTTVYNVFNLTWTESASMHKNDPDSEKYFSDIIEKAFRLLASGCTALIAVLALVFPLLINEKFDASYYQIPIYMLSAFLHSVIGIFSVVYIALKRTKEIARTSLFAAMINLVFNVCLIKYIGLYAASISSVVAYAILLFVRYLDIQKYVRVRIKKPLVCSVIIVFVLEFVTYYIRNTGVSFITLVGIVLYIILINRAMIVSVAGILRKRRKGV